MAGRRREQRKKQQRRRKEARNRGSRRAAPPPPPADPLSMPPATMMERMMGGLFGTRQQDNRSRAQELAYQAMQATDPVQAVQLAMQAVELDRDCVDALILLAQASSEDRTELIDKMRHVVAAGEKRLGKEFFEENRGYFWGLLETRPYMRARAHLAQLLQEKGELEQATAEYEAMLDLNPNDNQGLRYALMGCYLQRDRLEDAQRLFRQFEDEGSAMFAWARVLERYLRQDPEGAASALQQARTSNPHAEAYLVGAKRPPREMPSYYGIGDENEAIICAESIGPAWRAHPQAVAWLKNQERS